MNTDSESGLWRPNDPYDTRNLSRVEYHARNLSFNRNEEKAWEQIARVYYDQKNSPTEVPSVALAQSSVTPYTHILKVGEVAVYKSNRRGRLPVLVRTTFSSPDRLIEVEFETGHIAEVESWSLFWDEFWVENPGTEREKTGYSEVAAKIHLSHQHNYVAPFDASKFK